MRGLATDSGPLLSSPQRKPNRPIHFTVATAIDDSELERLLEQPMAGSVQIALPRKTPAAARGVDGERRTTVLARDPESEAVLGMGTRVVRRCWVGGRQVRIGYLCNLRQDSSLVATNWRAAGMVLRRGFPELFRHRQLDELPFDYTTILSDNLVARRLLERNVPGLPRYEFVGALSTLVYRTRGFRTRRPLLGGRSEPAQDGAIQVSQAQECDLPEIVDCLRRNQRGFDFAPDWTLEDLGDAVTSRGLSPQDFFVARQGGRIRALAAIWDQSHFKPIVVAGYRSSVRRIRPAVNLLQVARGAPRLPAPGPLSLAYLSHLAVDEGSDTVVPALFNRIRVEAAHRGLELLAVGLGSNEPILPAITKIVRPFVLNSRVYRVWPEGAANATFPLSADTIARPEIATL